MPNSSFGDADFLNKMDEVNRKLQMASLEIQEPEFDPSPIRDYRMADYAYEVIMDRIKEFEDELDDEHEIALKLASFGQSITLAVTDIGYSNPTTLVFYGYVGTQKATLVQNLNQLNFLLLAVKKADPEKPPRRIGIAVSTRHLTVSAVAAAEAVLSSSSSLARWRHLFPTSVQRSLTSLSIGILLS